MDISKYLKSHLSVISVNPAGLTKTAYLTTLCHELAVNTGTVKDVKELTAQVLKRESIESTGTGSGIAFPHARTEAVSEITLAVARIPGGMDFGAIDGKPVRIIVLMAVPTADIQPYLRILSHLSKRLRLPRIQEAVLAAGSPGELGALLAD